MTVPLRDKRLLSLAEVALLTGHSKATLQKAVKAGTLRAVRDVGGRKWYFTHDAIDLFIETGMEEVTDA